MDSIIYMYVFDVFFTVYVDVVYTRAASYDVQE